MVHIIHMYFDSTMFIQDLDRAWYDSPIVLYVCWRPTLLIADANMLLLSHSRKEAGHLLVEW